MADGSEPFGDVLRRYREAAGYSQEELAERAELTTNAISALERGFRRRPYPATVRRLAAALGLSDAERAELMAARSGGIPAPHSPPAAVAAVSTEPAIPPEPGLPEYMEPLIGREREMEVLLHLLGMPEVRLLTLTGPGGVGKTRLGSEVVRQALDLFPDGAIFVPLASLKDPALVLPAVAQVLGLRESGGRTPREVLRGYLQDRQMLLVLDNFEHVLGASPEVGEVLLACGRLKVVATSRAPLRLQGEQEYPVPPLAVPDLSRVPSLGDVERASSVALFVRRARQASPSFGLTPANALSIAAICRRLDGLPLAIELAAARVKLLPPPELLQRLDRSLPLLTGGARDLPERQRTMRDAIAWSYELLDEGEQALFRRLSVFAGEWTMDAAEAVGAGGDVDPEQVLDLLGRLVDQSLVVAEPSSDGSPRYRMLEPVRQYASELLGESREATEVRQRHAEFFLSLAEGAEPEVGRIEQAAQLDILEAEHANLRAALHWLECLGDETAALRMTASLGWFWLRCGHWSGGRTSLIRTLGRDTGRVREGVVPPVADAHAVPRARALYYAAELACAQGDLVESRPLYEGSVSTWRAVGDRRGLAQALHRLGEVLWSYGDAEGYARRTRKQQSSSVRWGMCAD